MKPARTFAHEPAVRGRVPLLLGIVGPSSSGKTFSALRLATGIQRVVGTDIFFIDTESRRGLHYADQFKFQHVQFDPPFGPLDYLAAIEYAVKQGSKIVVIDSMTHEHSGPGGVMDQSEKLLDKWCGDDWKAREKRMMMSLVRPKGERKKLNSAIVQLGINAVFCYRAYEKIKPVTGGEPLKLGWQPETTSPLHYEMTQRFLLTPGCDGKPSLIPETDAERQMVKNPEQFRGFFKPGVQLSEDLGEQMARWAAGDGPASPPAPANGGGKKAPKVWTLPELVADLEKKPAPADGKDLAARTDWLAGVLAKTLPIFDRHAFDQALAEKGAGDPAKGWAAALDYVRAERAAAEAPPAKPADPPPGDGLFGEAPADQRPVH